MTHNPKNGAWAPVCLNHCYLQTGACSNNFYRIPASSEFSIMHSLALWMEGDKQNAAHVDEGDWPSNKPCSGLGVINPMKSHISKWWIQSRLSKYVWTTIRSFIEFDFLVNEQKDDLFNFFGLMRFDKLGYSWTIYTHLLQFFNYFVLFVGFGWS